jgi:putative membrane protein
MACLDLLGFAGAAVAGTLAAALLGCIPGLHVYSAAALLVALAARARPGFPEDLLAMFLLGMTVGYAVVNTVPAIFGGAPDESTLFVVLPGQRYLVQGKGIEAAAVTGAGSLGGILALLLLAPLLPRVLPALRAVVAPHLHWILAAVALYMLLSEWPKGFDRQPSRVGRLAGGWRSPGAGLVTFVLSGLLGMALFYGSLVPPAAGFQNLFPAFTGLFAIPWVAANLLSRVAVPRQEAAGRLDLTPGLLGRGVLAGTLGGFFAAFFPAVTGGIGGLLAGQATAQRDDRLFLVSQGACKVVYLAGAYLLLFVPGLHLSRGGMSSMLSILYTPRTPALYWTAVGAVVLCGALAFGLLLALSRGAAWLVARVDYRHISAAVLVLLVALILAATGPGGLLIAAIATAIGLIPLLWGARRSDCLGVLLVPLTLQLAGLGPTVAGWLGLA